LSGFFLNQKSVFLFFLFTAESGSLSHTRGGTKPGHYCACLVGAPLSCLPCRISTASSCALQVFGHSCLCLSCLFGADCSEGSCLLFSDWPKWLCWMFFYSPNNSYSSKPQSVSLSHQDSLVWLQTEAAHGACCHPW
jgi:hypothetical protein